ncbi:hypothetical protein LX36DRAFT_260228 [Colletotrichum falcatum]|nr:hypothetical protein LX36DRAFT_260228 [Colletotrichum falcatum]
MTDLSAIVCLSHVAQPPTQRRCGNCNRHWSSLAVLSVCSRTRHKPTSHTCRVDSTDVTVSPNLRSRRARETPAADEITLAGVSHRRHGDRGFLIRPESVVTCSAEHVRFSDETSAAPPEAYNVVVPRGPCVGCGRKLSVGNMSRSGSWEEARNHARKLDARVNVQAM